MMTCPNGFALNSVRMCQFLFALEQLHMGRRIEQGRFKNQSGTVISDRFLHKDKQLVVPPNLKQEVLATVHNGSHLGMAKTKEVRKDLYWKGTSHDIEEFSRKCLVCSHCKHKTKPEERLVLLHIADHPRDVLHISSLPYHGHNRAISLTDHRLVLLVRRFGTNERADCRVCLTSIGKKVGYTGMDHLGLH